MSTACLAARPSRHYRDFRARKACRSAERSPIPPGLFCSEPPIFERCLQVVASFEGTQFTLIEGNFDGAGLTWGIIGFTLKNGEISSLLGEINVRFPDLLSQAFGQETAVLMQNLGPNASADQRMAFARSISGPPPKFRVAEPWRSGFA